MCMYIFQHIFLFSQRFHTGNSKTVQCLMAFSNVLMPFLQFVPVAWIPEKKTKNIDDQKSVCIIYWPDKWQNYI